MNDSDSNLEDNNSSSIYNTLPVELFTNDFDELSISEDDFDSDDKDFPTDEVITDFRDLPRTHSPEIPFEEAELEDENDILGSKLTSFLLEKTQQLATQEESQVQTPPIAEPVMPMPATPDVPSRSSARSIPPPGTATNAEDSGLWIRCTRCGKKNDLDCNFCGKCGLQIHKVISIVEAESDTENTNPEVVRNIKYHYKRPVFCFGPRGNCFASFSSPSKSVRNVVKFRLSTLPEFKTFLEDQAKSQVITGGYDRLWSEENFKNLDWKQREGYLRSLSAILASYPNFTLSEPFRQRLLEFFASISPKDLGSIKNLAVQDVVRYSRPDIDEIFHKLVLGQIKEACEECITYNYWDHALIIAKTLDTAFYENVMNRFLNARFSNGHPLRTLYLIMTSNEQAALEEIRGIIGDEKTVAFVKDIWPVLCNFLLRANPAGVSKICTIFEDIGNCLFEQKLYENALICYTVAVLTGTSFGKDSQIVERVDFLLSHFISHPDFGIVDFSGIRIVALLTERLSSVHSSSILWRCQFVQLMFAQYLYDLDSFDPSALIPLTQARHLGKNGQGKAKLLAEECTILCARQLVEESTTLKQETNPAIQSSTAVPLKSPLFTSPSSLPSASQASFVPTSNRYGPVQPTFTSTTTTTTAAGYEAAQKSPELAAAPPLLTSHSSSMTLSDSGFSPAASKQPSILEEELDNKNTQVPRLSSLPSQQVQAQSEGGSGGGEGLFTKWKIWTKNDNAKNDQQKPVIAKMGKKNTFRYDPKLKKWVDDNDPSTFEEAPKLAPPPVSKIAAAPVGNAPGGPLSSPAASAGNSLPAVNAPAVSYRATKKGKVKYFDPLNPDASESAVPTVPSFNNL